MAGGAMSNLVNSGAATPLVNQGQAAVAPVGSNPSMPMATPAASPAVANNQTRITPTPVPRGGYGGPAAPNINQMAAQGIYGAGLGAASEMGYTPQQIQAGQLSTTDIGQYQNPFTEQVIRANEADILRGAQMGLDILGAKAQAAGAYGGSRQAVAESEYGRNIAQQLAQSSAQLRQAGFQNAQQAALSDIQNRLGAQQFNVTSGLQGAQQRLGAGSQLANISNLGFGMGQQVQQNLAAQGAQQQALQQAIMDAAMQQYAGYTGAPMAGVGTVSGAISASPVPQTQTTSRKPGLFDYLTLAATGASGTNFGG